MSELRLAAECSLFFFLFRLLHQLPSLIHLPSQNRNRLGVLLSQLDRRLHSSRVLEDGVVELLASTAVRLGDGVTF